MRPDGISSSPQLRLAMATAVGLLLLAWSPSVSGLSAESQCDPPGVWQTGQALDETASRASGANVSLIEPTRSGKLQECVERCCKRDDCSVATVKAQDKGTVLCALFNCDPPEKCIFKNSARLLSLDRTASAFLRRVVASWPKYSNIEVHTGNLSSSDAASTPSLVSPTADTTLQFVAEATTAGSVANSTTGTVLNSNTSTTTSAPRTSTEDSDVNSPVPTSSGITTPNAVNVSTTPSTTRSPLGLSGILDLLNHVAESRTRSSLQQEASSSSTESEDHVSRNSQVTSSTPSTTEAANSLNVSSTTVDADISPPAFSDILEQPSSTQATTRTPTTVSPALEASMKKIVPTNGFNGEAWWSRMSVPLKASNLATNAPSVTKGPNTTEKTTAVDKTNDLRRPIQIFAPTTLNVDLVPKASPSISLVIGLCLGLLLIFVVMGLIGRRILDVWQRRHYSKMDFLVDGMYHVT